ncbi:hypothetical protein [Neobacillus massiliamazoniensis]|uniref:Uncharacterized protein n=1 Tax=Neobacillus massiliamazoniensis TaxID=1499688 RepID=A0A0U1NQK5_9BACI|nr:hypothetical protein [Neobacillus massiliamazoniensis]CRK80319.1 hypothetical protein BN000_00200 [Neobacillus massiliamazoniensis]
MPLEINERKQLRSQLMIELYNHYFESGGKSFHTTREELVEDREKDLAYNYLIEKGFISADRQGNLRPTTNGIDYVEK